MSSYKIYEGTCKELFCHETFPDFPRAVPDTLMIILEELKYAYRSNLLSQKFGKAEYVKIIDESECKVGAYFILFFDNNQFRAFGDKYRLVLYKTSNNYVLYDQLRFLFKDRDGLEDLLPNRSFDDLCRLLRNDSYSDISFF